MSHDLEIWLRVHSRLLKLVPFESLGAVSYSPSIAIMAVSEFLLAFHSNCGDILYHLRDLASYWSKIAKFLYPTCI